MGSCHAGDSLNLIGLLPDESIDLALASPPFALERKKSYGNPEKIDYVAWLGQFLLAVRPKLKASGSVVLDIGGSYEKGRPVRSLYPFRLLIHAVDDLGYRLAEDFYWHNPARLPSPIEWVNKRRCRAKDSVDTVWWLSKSDMPKADNRRVLQPYSKRMKRLIGLGQKREARPSGHMIEAGIAVDRGGAVPSNLLQIPNTASASRYQKMLRTLGMSAHPARFPEDLPRFFIRFLTEPGDVVLDFFAGSNTTGYVAEQEGRRWISFEREREFVAGSLPRFMLDASAEAVREACADVRMGKWVALEHAPA